MVLLAGGEQHEVPVLARIDGLAAENLPPFDSRSSVGGSIWLTRGILNPVPDDL
jgi:hypothetical protein